MVARVSSSVRVGGFTLIEVMVALIIAAFLIGSSMVIVGQVADERFGYGERLAASAIGWNRILEQYQLVEGWVPREDLAETDGELEAFGREWQWMMEVEPTLGANFFRYEVVVTPSGSATDRARVTAYFIVEQ